MVDTETRWNAYVEQRLAQNPKETIEDIESELLNGNMFDPDEPYVCEIARLALDELDFQIQ